MADMIKDLKEDLARLDEYIEKKGKMMNACIYRAGKAKSKTEREAWEAWRIQHAHDIECLKRERRSQASMIYAIEEEHAKHAKD